MAVMPRRTTQLSGVPSKPSLEDMMNMSSDQLPRPKALPIGWYMFIIRELPRHDKSTQKQTEFYEFTCYPIEAMKHVDEDALAEAGGLEEKSIRLTFYKSEKAMYRFTEFAEALGFKNATELVNGCVGTQFIAHVTHSLSQDSKRHYANIDDRTALPPDASLDEV